MKRPRLNHSPTFKAKVTIAQIELPDERCARVSGVRGRANVGSEYGKRTS